MKGNQYQIHTSWQQNSPACPAVEQCAHTDIYNLGMVIVLLSPDELYEYFFLGGAMRYKEQQLIFGIIQYTNALNSDKSNN